MRILSIIEATTVTGPAKNLLNFCRLLRSSEFAPHGKPPVEISIATFHRGSVSEPGAVVTGSNTQDSITDPVATALVSDTTPNAFVAAARKLGVTVDVINERFRFDPGAISQLRAIVARRRPDIIQTHMIKSHFLVKLSGLGKQHPWIAYHHGYTTTNRKMLVYNQLNRWSLPSANRVITVCEAFAMQLARAGVRREKITVSHNAVTPPREVSASEQEALRQRCGIKSDHRTIVSIGRLSSEKGHADLLHAIALLHEMGPMLKFKLVLVGDGPERETLETMSSDLRLNEQIVFAGQVADVAPFYAIADVLALPSHSEGSPNVLLEAMAAGIPVVATAVGGVPEIATSDEDALLVAAREPHQFSIALHRLLSESALAEKFANAGRARALDFSPAAYASRLLQIYDEVSEPRATGRGSSSRYCFDPMASASGSERI